MIRYADPEVCPCCRQAIPYAATQCRHCGATLSGPDAQALFRSLTFADSLVTKMTEAAAAAREPVATPVAVGVGAAPSVAPPSRPHLDTSGFPAHPAAPTRPARAGLGAPSVPRILLGLGATCLLAAAIVFLVVAWGDLGFGARTLILLALTTGAAVATGELARRGLPAGAESFGLLFLGFLTLDLSGARTAGWLDAFSWSGFLVLVGAVLATAGMVTAGAVTGTSLRPLVGAQLAAVAGAALAAGAVTDLATAEASVRALLVVALASVAGLARTLGLRFAATGLALLSGTWWLMLAGLGLERALYQPSVTGVWGDLAGAPLLAAAALVAVPSLARSLPETVRVTAAAIAVFLATLVVVAPVTDEAVEPLVLAGLAVVAAGAGASYLLRGRWQWLPVAPALAAGLGLVGWAVEQAGHGLETLLELGVWTLDVTGTLPGWAAPAGWLALVPAAVLGAVVAVAVALRPMAPLAPRLVGDLALTGVGLTMVLLPGLYDVPLWSAVAVQVAVVGLLAVAGRSGVAMPGPAPWTVPTAGAIVGTCVAAGTALANDWLTAAMLAVFTVLAAWGSSRGRGPVRTAADVALAPVAGAFVWTVLHLAGGDLDWRAVPVVLIAGLLAVVRPTFARETGGTLAVLVAVPASVLTADTVDLTWLAVYLTLAGALVMVSALRNLDRPELGWTGLGLLTLAQWVRLSQLGVDTVEAYTLPLALVLVGVGLVRMRDPQVSSRRALSAGLGLALGPSLLLVLVEPVTFRAFWLGLACLVLVVAGVLLRWSAPLVAGAAVGVVLVLREAQAAQIAPQWLLIGLVGTVLTVVGVTWEQRLADLRKAAAYVRRLR